MKRYELDWVHGVEESTDGEYIRYADHCEAMRRIAAPSASAQQAEPVAWIAEHDNNELDFVNFYEDKAREQVRANDGRVRPLIYGDAAPAPSAQQAEKTVAAIDSALRGKVNDPDPLPKLHAHSVAGEPTTYGLVAALLRERDALLAKVAKFDQRIVDLGVLAMETAAPAPASPAALTGWYCAHCKRGVDASEVTYNEQHTICGRVITDDDPPPAKQTAEAAELVRLWEAQSHIDAIAWGNRATDLLRGLAASPADQGEDARDAKRWVPVAYDSQPPHDTDVFVRGKDACGALRHDVAGMFNGYWMSQSTQNDCDFKVSHWMPIPMDAAMSASKDGESNV